jgi:hypothetical protein
VVGWWCGTDDGAIENEKFIHFFEGHQAYGVLSNFSTTDLASCDTSKLTLSSDVRMRIMILRRKHVHKCVWCHKPEDYLTSETMGYDWETVVKEMGCKNCERVGYIGLLAKFVDKDRQNYQWAELNVTEILLLHDLCL